VQVSEHNKRHLCAFQVVNDTQKEPWRWWDYAAGKRRRLAGRKQGTSVFGIAGFQYG
jgi:hypothetical protein